MMPIGSSSRTNGRLVIRARPTLQVARRPSKEPAMRVLIQRSVLQRLNGRGGAALGGEWALRHARRRVHLTLRLDGDEARSRCGPTPAGGPPAPVFALEGFRARGGDPARRPHPEDAMVAP